MSNQVLVVFASKYGNTAEIAERIGKVLREAGLQTDVLPAKFVLRNQPPIRQLYSAARSTLVCGEKKQHHS